VPSGWISIVRIEVIGFSLFMSTNFFAWLAKRID
jgi:hypothetical protein